MSDFFGFLVETNLVTAAFVIGAISFIIAIVGNIKTIIEPSPATRVLLALFGLLLMTLSFSSFFMSNQTEPEVVDNPATQVLTVPVIETPIVLPAVATETPSFIVRTECSPSENVSLGNGFSGAMEEDTTPKAVKIYTHCPPISPVKYDDVTVDDNLDKVELVCANSTTDITAFFLPLNIQGELLPHYQSQPIDVPNGCRIDFTVRDSLGDKISIKVRSSGVP